MDFATLKTRVLDRLRNRTDITAALQTNFVVDAQKTLEREGDFPFMEARTTGTISANAYTLSLPTRFKAIKKDCFLVTDTAGALNPLEQLSVGEAYRKYPFTSDNEAMPKVVAIQESTSQFLIRPTADVAYAYELQYYQYLATLSADGDTNWWTDNAWQLLLYGAMLQATAYLGDSEEYLIYEKLYLEELDRVRRTETARTWSGSVQRAVAHMPV